jgi:hypothetical protein
MPVSRSCQLVRKLQTLLRRRRDALKLRGVAGIQNRLIECEMFPVGACPSIQPLTGVGPE